MVSKIFSVAMYGRSYPDVQPQKCGVADGACFSTNCVVRVGLVAHSTIVGAGCVAIYFVYRHLAALRYS